MKVVLAGDYGTSNLGDQGMLAVLRERLIERTGGETELVVLSRHPSREYEELYRVRTLSDLHEPGRGQRLRGFNAGEGTADLEAIAEAIREADALVLGGGRVFFDHDSGFLRGELAAWVQLTSLARFLGTPVMLFAMTVVHERSRGVRESLRFLAEMAEIVTVRELPSRDHLVDLGLDRSHIHVLPDPTLGLPLLEPGTSYGHRLGSDWMADADGVLRPLELEPDRPTVAVNLRSFAWRDGPEGQKDNERQLAAFLDRVVAECGCQLLFVPQRTYDQTGREDHDDRAMARRVVERMEREAETRSVESELSIWQALALYQRVDALISMRRHGLAFALTQRVPVLALGLDENAAFLMASLGLTDRTLSLAPARVAKSLGVVREVLEAEPDAHASLFAHVEDCAARTRVYVDLLAERLGEPPA